MHCIAIFHTSRSCSCRDHLLIYKKKQKQNTHHAMPFCLWNKNIRFLSHLFYLKKKKRSMNKTGMYGRLQCNAFMLDHGSTALIDRKYHWSMHVHSTLWHQERFFWNGLMRANSSDLKGYSCPLLLQDYQCLIQRCIPCPLLWTDQAVQSCESLRKYLHVQAGTNWNRRKW